MLSPAPLAAAPAAAKLPPPPADDAPASEHDAYWLRYIYAGDDQRQLTVRALLIGSVIGGIMSFSNLYVGLKTGWGLGAAITSAVLAFSLFTLVEKIAGTPKDKHFTLLENNTTQTAASAAAYMTSAGLVSAIPALYMVTKQALTPLQTGIWLIGVSLLGIVAAIPVKRKLINQERLRFPSGIACAETLRSLHAEGSEGAEKGKALGAAAGLGGLVAVLRDGLHILPETLPVLGAVAAKRTVAFEPSLIMVGAGALMGLRVTISMLVTGFVCFYILPDILFDAGVVTCGKVAAGQSCTAEQLSYRDINAWTLWPGVSLMVAHSLVGLAVQLPGMIKGLSKTLKGGGDQAADDVAARLREVEVPMSWFWSGLAVAGGMCMFLQYTWFDIPLQWGALAVVLSLLLAFVAARSTGETDVTPVGAMGKVTQLVFGGVMKGAVGPNLMAACVTGGSASHAGDLLTDMKAGYLVGARPRYQVLAQVMGVFVGAVFATAAYAILVNPDELGSEKWPAPAAVIWGKVAELLSKGIDQMEPAKLQAILWGSVAGAVWAVVEMLMPAKARKWMPSIAGVGVAAMVPFWNSLSMFLGAVLADVFARVRPKLAERYTVVASSGLIAGETLMAVVIIAFKVLA